MSTAPVQKQMHKRRSGRVRVLKSATITFGPEETMIRCNILDLSERGAKILAPNLPDGLDGFILRLNNDEVHCCRIVWHTKEKVGVEFMTETETEPKTGDGHDRRRSPRDKMLRLGQIVFADGNCTMDCTVLDLSKNGALLAPQDLLTCPEMFELRIKYGPSHPCKVVRSNGRKLSVRFLDVDD